MVRKGRARKGMICSAALLVCLCALSTSASALDCYQRNKFSEPLRWLSSATWVNALQSMAVVDPLANQLKLFSPEGVARSSINPVVGQPGTEFLPAELEQTKDGFALSMVDGDTLFLDETLRVRKRAAIATLSTKGGAGIRTLYQWTVTDGTVVGYGSVGIQGKPDEYRLGIFRAPLAATNRAQILLPFDNGDYYVLGHDYFTNIGRSAYFMLASASEDASIYEVSERGALRKLRSFPPAFRSLPEIKTKMTGPKSAEALFAEIETLTMPVGLYGYKGMLYLLARHHVKGATEWLLYQINPKADRIVGSPIKLPTKTEHLAIVTSPDRWFLIERGKVLPLGQQNIETFLTLPSSWITSERSPLRGIHEPANCPVSN